MCSAYDSNENTLQAKNIGMKDSLPKPVKKDHFDRILAKYYLTWVFYNFIIAIELC